MGDPDRVRCPYRLLDDAFVCGGEVVMKSILDPSFKYVSAAKTDLKATFRRIRLAQKAAEEAKPSTNVYSVKRVAK